MRRVISSVLRVILRVFFPRIEISGIDRVPRDGPVMLAVNHPNGLIDPLFLLCLSPRPVSFLAKAPLFEMPVISWFVTALGSIPVYRRQDGGFDPAKNRQTFERARAILASGGVIAIFPEGASHDDPKMRPLKTGAARIALGATSMNSDGEPLTIVPLGIYYTAKRLFRSSALLYFGEPVSVTPAPLKPNGEPPSDAVHAVTERIEQALSDVTLQADEHEALALVARAEEVFSSEDPAAAERLVDKFELRRRFMAGYATLRTNAPERLAAITARITRYETELRETGLDPHTLRPAAARGAHQMGEAVKTVGVLILGLPIALIGAIVNYPAYRMVAFIATGLSRGDEGIVATIKLIAGALLFPLAWIIVALAVGFSFGALAGVGALVLAPISGYVALLVFERLDELRGSARAVAVSQFQRWGYLRLVAERTAIRQEIMQLAADFEA
ncbi:MAG TPA: lysophospholipid acyltransferase family protein [Gemmatimonadaceae bacterium]|nr:lysophospholipid acyltransferase family protein [Gemmatimonadaceae bacterium]